MSKAHQVVVAGVPNLAGAPPDPRLPIQVLKENDRQWSLYVRAVAKMMEGTTNDALSWFSVGGIHGHPIIDWDSVPGEFFCTHKRLLFPTWHRAYVLLYEQALVNNAIEIAKEYQGSDAKQWAEAAQSLRSPYWDWSGPSKALPDEVIRSETLTVTFPTGKDVVKPNPLLGYSFKAKEEELLDNDADDGPKSGPKTVRHPADSDPVQGLMDAIKELDNPNNPIGDRVKRMLYSANSWVDFSTNASGSDMSVVNSLEAIHNTIHVTAGGRGTPENEDLVGHMSLLEYAAFDPLFWMHHTNVDRLFALWQALHTREWVPSQPVPGIMDDTVETLLQPFWQSAENDVWKSSTQPMYDYRNSNYTYPEFVVHDLKSGTELSKAELVRRIEHAFSAGGTTNQPARAMAPFAINAPETSTFEEWVVRIKSSSRTVKQTFEVFVFLGEPPESSLEWPKCKELVGIHTEFNNRYQGHCANCNKHPLVVSEGYISLRPVLELRNKINQPSSEIDQYLKDNLRWRILKINGKVLQPEEVQNFEVAVLTAPFKYSNDDGYHTKPLELAPTYRHFTAGMPGGRAV